VVARKIKLENSNLHALVDSRDYNRVRKFKWFLIGSHGGHAARRTKEGSIIYMHHFIIGSPKNGFQIDHRNRNKLDNRRNNFRNATKNQNEWNRGKRKTNTSGFKGVCWYPKYEKWLAQIMANGKHMFLGYFNSPIEAAKVHDKAARKLHGEFAVTNFPMRFCREPRFPRLVEAA
jgi:hypothetical protein